VTAEAVPVDVDALPPTQFLLLEVLAARTRLGEHLWTFPTSVLHAARRLQDHGLVEVFGAPEPKTFRARLSDAGRERTMDGGYALPDAVKQRDEAQAMLAEVAELAMQWRDERGEELLRTLSRREDTT
jgi:hypothetical protein